MKFNDTLKDLIVLQIKNNNNIPALIGDPAIGKTKFTQEIAEALGAKPFIINVNELSSKEDLSGPRVIEENGRYVQKFFPHHDIMQAVEYADEHPDELVLLTMDEINRSGPDVTSVTLSVVTSRRIGSYDIPENLRFIVTGNDRGNITALDEASISRFTIWHVEPDAETFLAIMAQKGQEHPWITQILTENPELIFCRKIGKDTEDPYDLDDDAMDQLTGPRTLEGLINTLNSITENGQKPENMHKLFGEAVEVHGEQTNVGEQLIISHIGETEFSGKLIEMILRDMDLIVNKSVATNHAAAISVPNDVMEDLLNATDISDIELYLSQLDHDVFQDVALSLLMDPSLTAQRKLKHVEIVFELTPGFDTDHRKKLTQIINDEAYVRSNLKAATKRTTAQVPQMVKNLAEALGAL